MNAKVKEFFSVRRICFLAVFTALSYVLYVFVKFPLPMLFPSFLDFQISDLPPLIAGFMFGPIEAGIIILLKILLKLPLSSTAFVGELADLLIGLSFVLPASIIYQIGIKALDKKTAILIENQSMVKDDADRLLAKKSFILALIGLSVGSLLATGVAILANYLILVPFYVEFFFKGNWAPLLGMVSALYPDATSDTFYAFYLPLGVLPFNLLRCLLSSGLTLLLHTRLKRAYKTLFAHKNLNEV